MKGFGVLNVSLLGLKPKECKQMKKILDKNYEQDEYFKRWLVGLSPITKQNYTERVHDWIAFVNMNLSE